MTTYHLWQRYGVELEYMLVDKDTLNISPRAHQVLLELGADEDGDLARDQLVWSNELTNHVLELKTSPPRASFENVARDLHEEVAWMSRALHPMGLALLPTAMHPWMDPRRETMLWPLGHAEIYQTYHRLFDCHSHGWANLQSLHLNLSFNGDHEFGLLHAAVRLMLPLLPALCASSPIMDGLPTGLLDTRLKVYQDNQRRFPTIAGDIIPEPLYSSQTYSDGIYNAIEEAVRPHDPEGVLEAVYLNSRGAIARFDRNAIEIRLMDIQECPRADLAITEFVIASLKVFSRCHRYTLEELQAAPTQALARLLNDSQCGGMAARVAAPELRRLYQIGDEEHDTISHVLRSLLLEVKDELSEDAQHIVRTILRQGNLATRILNALPPSVTPAHLQKVYRELGDCLLQNQIFRPHS